jgi:hypothetical protein
MLRRAGRASSWPLVPGTRPPRPRPPGFVPGRPGAPSRRPPPRQATVPRGRDATPGDRDRLPRPRPDAPPAGHRGGRLVDGGADQWVAKAHAAAESDQSCRFRWSRLVHCDLLPHGRATTSSRHNRFGRCGKQQLLRVARKHFELQVKAVFNAALQRRCGGKPRIRRQFGRSQPAGQLQQRERVTAGFSDDPVAHLLGISSRSQPDRVGLPDGRVAV